LLKYFGGSVDFFLSRKKDLKKKMSEREGGREGGREGKR
jgi:hypothetical protein